MNNPEHISPLAVSVEDAARVVGYSRSGVYELIAAGDLKAFKQIGRAHV